MKGCYNGRNYILGNGRACPYAYGTLKSIIKLAEFKFQLLVLLLDVFQMTKGKFPRPGKIDPVSLSFKKRNVKPVFQLLYVFRNGRLTDK
jgi:hypothetical protein